MDSHSPPNQFEISSSSRQTFIKHRTAKVIIMQVQLRAKPWTLEYTGVRVSFSPPCRQRVWVCATIQASCTFLPKWLLPLCGFLDLTESPTP